MTNHPTTRAGPGKNQTTLSKEAVMNVPQTPIRLGPIPKHFRLRRGQALTCIAGYLWITSDALAGRGPDSDVVLGNGQSFVTPQASTYFVGAPLGCGVLSFSSTDARARNTLETTC
jgi:Protein of unknown function (DUF2917)